MPATPYATIIVYQPPQGQGGTTIAVCQSGTTIMPATVLADDLTASGNAQTFARVIPTAPAGTENGLVVREAQMGGPGTGITPPTGGTGVLGFLSGIYQALATGFSIAVGGTDYVEVDPQTGGDTLVKNGPGILNAVQVTAAVQGAPAVFITDDTAGPIIGVIPANAPLGSYPFNCKAYVKIVVGGNANNPGMTVQYT